MGQLKEITTVETERDTYLVEAWRGGGYTTNSKYKNPAILSIQNDYGEFELIEEWSANYGKEKKPRKTESQILAEAIKKIRFYDDTNIKTATINGIEIEEGNQIAQPNIESKNIDWEIYTIGSSKISHKGTKQEILDKLNENGVVFDKNGEPITSAISNS